MTQPPRRPSRPPAAPARRGDGQTPHARRGVPPPARGAVATNAASAAAVASSSAVYWQAQCEAALYAAPLGNVVGVAAAGTIIREHERFADPFGGVWLATHSTAATNDDDDVNDYDEQHVWVCGVDGDAWASSSSVVPPPPPSSCSPQWRRVSDAHVDDNDDADATTTTTRAADVCIMCSSNDDDDDDSGESDLLCDAALLDYYWTSSATAALRARSRRQQQQQHNDDCKSSNNDSDEGCRNDICRSSVSWNARYQEAVEALMLPQQPQQHDDDNNDGDDDARVVALQACLDAFAAVAQAAVVTLLEDLPRATCERRMVQHATQPHAFYLRSDSRSSSGDDDGDSATHGDLLLRLVVDTADGRYGGDAAAHAAAARQFRGYRLLAHVAPRWLLSLPLTALVTFGGHCVAVTALPPIVSRACVYDNSNNNNNNVTCDALVSQLLTGVGHALNLRTHHVGTRTTTATMPRDVRVYAGRDRRLYVLRAGRVLPPLLPPPPSSRRVGDTPVVRAELLLRWPAPLNPDVDVRHDASCKCHEGSSSNLADDDENDDVSVARALARCVRDEVVTHVANILGMHAPVQLTGAAHEHALPLCTLCDVALADDELRFVVCTHADGCCAVCTHCYTRRVHDTAAGMTATAACSSSSSSSCTSASSPRVASLRRRDVATWCGRARFDDAVRCGTTPPRRGNALRLVPDLTALMHASGLCMRLLPFVLHRLPPAAAPFVRHYGEVEMLARAAARVLRRRLRRLPAVTPQHMQHTIEHVLRCLLVPRRRLRRTRNDNNNNDHADDDDDDMVAARFWADELGPELQRHFVGVTKPFDTTALSPLLLAERVQQLTGVTLDDASIASLRDTSYDDDSDNDNNDDSNKSVVVRVAQVQPLVKTYTTPQPHRHRQRVGDSGDDDAVRLRGVLERVLLFWIARAHDHGVSDDDDDVAPAQQPFYLRDSFVHASVAHAVVQR